MHIQWLDPWAILSIIWAIFKDFRDFFGVACTKSNLLESMGRRPTINSLEGVVRNIAGGMIPVRHNIGWDFKREYFQTGINSDKGTKGIVQSTVRQARKLQGQIPSPIATMLQPIFSKYGYKLRLNTLLRCANTNINEMLDTEGAGLCGKSLLLGSCIGTCNKKYNWKPPAALVNRIVQKLSPGIRQYVDIVSKES